MFWEFLSAHHLQPVDILESRSVVFHCKISRELKYQMVFRSAIYSLLKFWRVVFGDILLSRFSRKLILKNFFAVRRLQLSCTAMLSLYSPHLFLQVCCSVLQCVAVCCIVLQCDSEYLQCADDSAPLFSCRRDAVWCSVLQRVAVCCSMLAMRSLYLLRSFLWVCCIVLQRVAACCSVFPFVSNAQPVQPTFILAGVLQCRAVCCSVLWKVALCCSVL